MTSKATRIAAAVGVVASLALVVPASAGTAVKSTLKIQ